MPPFSVVIIVKQRRKQLANVLDSIARADIAPFDIQVVCMDAPDDIDTSNPLVHIHTMDSKDTLPLAAARNRGMHEAQTEHIIFIDVDCIVSPTLFTSMLEALTPQVIIAAYPLYLPTVPENGDFNASRDLAVPHPARETIAVGVPIPHLDFWSLIFAVHKRTFVDIGGFDESFTGYGAEDTDFAMSFHVAGIEQIFVRDYVLHQYHDKYDPPLNHFIAIIANAERYYAKWQVLPMGRWLRLFAEKGLIRIADDKQITILRQPSDTEIQANLSKHPY